MARACYRPCAMRAYPAGLIMAGMEDDITETSYDVDELKLAKEAFVKAHGRFLDAHATNNPPLWYASLGETLWWIFALYDHYTNSYKQMYLDFRNSSQYGAMIPGLKLARNKVGHGLALLV